MQLKLIPRPNQKTIPFCSQNELHARLVTVEKLSGNIQHNYMDVPLTIVRAIRNYFSENERGIILNWTGNVDG